MTTDNRKPGSSSAMSSGAYAGDLLPRDAWELLKSDPNAVLVDCRSQAEWTFVGLPDLSSLGKKVVRVPWQNWSSGDRPAMIANSRFVEDLAQAGVRREGPVVFLCRSGGRSKAAAIAVTAAGFARGYNLAGGFEGPHDDAKHRGTVDGWKRAGLPWAQE
jgi:rhodanese-related sulfurtransferase